MCLQWFFIHVEKGYKLSYRTMSQNEKNGTIWKFFYALC